MNEWETKNLNSSGCVSSWSVSNALCLDKFLIKTQRVGSGREAQIIIDVL